MCMQFILIINNLYNIQSNNLYEIMQINRYQSQRPKSSQRKSLNHQINLLLHKNHIAPTHNTIKPSQNLFSKTITISRNKVKSSQGNYDSRRNSIENTKQKFEQPQPIIVIKQKLNKGKFTYEQIIGRGGFGKVWKVIQKKTGKVFAMKQMSKAVILAKKSVASVNNEKTLLTHLKNIFLVNMHFSFQDREKLYLVMQFMQGGDLRYHICKRKKFNEQQARFFIACIFAGLEFIHSRNIIHRDIKPENLVIDSQGYVRITDLGIAKEYRPENNVDTSGTPGYMAPQVMCRQAHSFVVDYYALGVIAYQLMIGKRPYPGRSRKQIRQQILMKQTIIRKNEIPQGWSIQAADFINKMIQRKPILRLGWGGAQEIKKHPWLKKFPWDKLYKKQLISPFIPEQKQDNFDHRHHLTVQDQQLAASVRQNSLLLKKNSVQELFEGYTFEDEPKTSQVNTTCSEFTKKK